MVAIATPDVLSNGIYTQQQAAYLARLRPQTVARWFDSSSTRGPAVKRMFPGNEDSAVSFVDLIQLMAVRSIRSNKEISLQKIRQVVSKAGEMGIDFPLAKKDVRIYRYFGNTIVIQLGDEFIEASGKFAKHYLMGPVVLPYLEDITFDDNGLVSTYRPRIAPGVIIDPRRQWGSPVVEKCNYTVAALVNAVRSEGSIEAAADMCDVSVADVNEAIRFEDFLQEPA